MRDPKYKRITPLRALDLLLAMHRDVGRIGNATTAASDMCRKALEDEVRAALQKARRR